MVDLLSRIEVIALPNWHIKPKQDKPEKPKEISKLKRGRDIKLGSGNEIQTYPKSITDSDGGDRSGEQID